MAAAIDKENTVKKNKLFHFVKPSVSENEEYWCYDNKEDNCNKIDRLYNWKVANSICPKNTHLPTLEEFQYELSKINLENIIYDKEANSELTQNNFIVILAGMRTYGGNYTGLGKDANYWTSTINENEEPYYIKFDAEDKTYDVYATKENAGLSVICIENYSGINSKNIKKIKRAVDAVDIWDVSLIPDEYNYSDVIKLSVSYANKSLKNIIGIEIQIKAKNAFGKVVYNKILQDEQYIPAGARVRPSNFWVIEDNPFINGQPYDLLISGASQGTIKIESKVLKVIFEDGEVLK